MFVLHIEITNNNNGLRFYSGLRTVKIFIPILTAAYCRLSDEDKNKLAETDDSESIQNQKNMLIEYSLKNGWNIYDIYSDDDFRGSDRNRPEFNRILADAEQRKFDIILCKSQARFTRELELVEKFIHMLITKAKYIENMDFDKLNKLLSELEKIRLKIEYK